MKRRSLLLLLLLPVLDAASVFDEPDLQVAPSPSMPVQVRLADGVRVTDFDVSPAGPLVALLVSTPAGSQEIRLWSISQTQPAKIFDVPAGFSAQSIVWHPVNGSLFLAGAQGQQYSIFKIENNNGNRAARRIYSSRQEIRRLLAGPRPYLHFDESGQKGISSYRLFFGRVALRACASRSPALW